MTNWKTTAAGAGAVLTFLGVLAHCVSTGDYSPLGTAVPGLIAGAGMIFAADAHH